MSIHRVNSQPLAKSLRAQLEATVKAAREVAERGARAALAQLAVGEAKPPEYLDEDAKALRRRLRAHGRALGDLKAPKDDTQAVTHLVWEVAYEHWHRMLFARFLAENGLLLWEPGAAVSLDDCEALVQETDPAMNLGAKTKWELAGKLAARMLPQVFKPHSPVFELAFAPEHQRELERLLAALPPDVFKASDSLGWVYQFWQAKRKDEVNASEGKIGADELPAVTQMFTEPYMVEFLLHNSLGAWWMTRHPGKTCPVPLTYFRTLDDGTPAAGRFEGWPDRLRDFKLLDPCCGSGHFLVAAFLLLVPMRMETEGLNARDAVDAVLADNLHGLELDARCVEIAVFALALAAWRFPDENGDALGVRADMPAPQVACCGLKVAAKPQDWIALVPDDATNAAYLRQELRLLHASFAQAPLLGSLLDPARTLKNDLAISSFETLRSLLGRALATERPATLLGPAGELQDDSWDLALTAKGLLDAARLLDGRYHLVVTNVPYLARGKQDDALKDYCETNYAEAKNDLANVFVERCLELTKPDGRGIAQIVMPENWLYLTTYSKQRKKLLDGTEWPLVVKLGFASFQVMDWWAIGIILLTLRNQSPNPASRMAFLDCSPTKQIALKIETLQSGSVGTLLQCTQVNNPDSRVTLTEVSSSRTLGRVASALQGIKTGDDGRLVRQFWEPTSLLTGWKTLQSTVESTSMFGGLSLVVRWDDGGAGIARLQGKGAWGKPGIAVSLMNEIRSAIFVGQTFDSNVSVVTPTDQAILAGLWMYCSSPLLNQAVKEIEPGVKANNGVLGKIEFDQDRWIEAARAEYPNGIPKPYSDDPTQWLFHGHPQPATDPLQVAVARLAGYRWPAETDTAMELADEARTWIARCDKLAEHTDDDGIVCLPSVRGEPPAHDRLLKLLIASWETAQPGSWKPAVLDKLLAEADSAGKGLDVWLRNKFFEQHARRFLHRPFIWHVWDGLKDGFAALVNYHQLDARKLDRLIHTYLGDWIRQQEGGVRDGVDGASLRLQYAQDLQRRLKLIQAGEAPYDIFVRWKPIGEQPIGWNPDMNDGVSLNIRPFMTAEVLRHNKKPKLNISWEKDRGKDVETTPWFKVFKGDRINDHHLTLDEKRKAREGK